MPDPNEDKPNPLDKPFTDEEIAAALDGEGEETTDDAVEQEATGEGVEDAAPASDDSASADDGDEAPKEFGKHPRWQKIIKDRNEARDRATAIEAERDAARTEAADARKRAEDLAYYQQMNSFALEHPEAMRRAEEVYRIAHEPLPEGAQKDPIAARLALLERQAAQNQAAQQRQSQQADQQARAQAEWQGEVKSINEFIAKSGIPPEHQNAFGQRVHSIYRDNKARGAAVPIATVGKELLDFARGFSKPAAGAAPQKDQTGTAPAAKGATPTIRASGGRVPISGEADQKPASKLVRDSATGRIDISKTLTQAGKQLEEQMRHMKAGRP